MQSSKDPDGLLCTLGPALLTEQSFGVCAEQLQDASLASMQHHDAHVEEELLAAYMGLL
jgi:hypothetical protein